MYNTKFEGPEDWDALVRLSKRLQDTEFEHWPTNRNYFDEPSALAQNNIQFRRLLLDRGGEVCAKINFYEHLGCLESAPNSFVWASGILSESVVNPEFRGCGKIILKQSLKLQPRQMVMGHITPKTGSGAMFLNLGWYRGVVPLFLLPLKGSRCVKELSRKRFPKFLHQIFQNSIVAGLIGHFIDRRRKTKKCFSYEETNSFGEWATDLWNECHPYYRWLVLRNAKTMNWQYGDKRITKIRVKEDGTDVGFLCVSVVKNSNDPLFGNLKLGIIVDGLCKPQHVQGLLSTAATYLETQGAEIIYAIWSHKAWVEASQKLGFIRFETSQSIYISPGMQAVLGDIRESDMHLGRGDCDGPSTYLI